MESSSHIAANAHLRATLDSLTASETKLLTWLVGAASLAGGFPLEVSLREIKEGFTRDAPRSATVPGWGAHYRTINSALSGLQLRRLFDVGEGRMKGFGHSSKVFMPTRLLTGQ